MYNTGLRWRIRRLPVVLLLLLGAGVLLVRLGDLPVRRDLQDVFQPDGSLSNLLYKWMMRIMDDEDNG